MDNNIIRIFTLKRNKDISGVSGTGVVLYGVVYPSGKCIVEWLMPKPHGSINVFDSWLDFYNIHVASHPENESEINIIFAARKNELG